MLNLMWLIIHEKDRFFNNIMQKKIDVYLIKSQINKISGIKGVKWFVL